MQVRNPPSTRRSSQWQPAEFAEVTLETDATRWKLAAVSGRFSERAGRSAKCACRADLATGNAEADPP